MRFIRAAALLLALSTSQAMAQTGQGAAQDITWKTSLAYLADGSGIWITSNAQYRTEDNGEPPTYGMRYWMGTGGATQHGCLWGDMPGRDPAVFWSYFRAWDPTRKQFLVHQAAPNGTIGMGYEKPETGVAEQTFTRPDGMTWEDRHISSSAPPDTLVTQSFGRSQGGDWEARRTYRWVRQPAGTLAPC
jgi:hypothetical protein